MCILLELNWRGLRFSKELHIFLYITAQSLITQL